MNSDQSQVSRIPPGSLAASLDVEELERRLEMEAIVWEASGSCDTDPSCQVEVKGSW